jgi:predicted MFS family arabinose efflux permease
VVTPVAARYIDRLGYMRSLQSGLTISICGILMTLLPSLVFVIAGLAICSTGVFLCQSATISGIAKNVTEGRSLATGLYYLSYYAGGAVGTWLAGIAFESHGWSGSVVVIALAQTLAASIVTVVWGRASA